MRSRRYLHTLFITVSLVLLAGFFTLALANAQEGPTTTRVSVASDGTQGNSGSEDPAISADGRFVAFESEADNLVPGDTNDRVDIFVYDRQSGQTEQPYLLREVSEIILARYLIAQKKPAEALAILAKSNRSQLDCLILVTQYPVIGVELFLPKCGTFHVSRSTICLILSKFARLQFGGSEYLQSIGKLIQLV